MRAFLGQVGRREVYRDALEGQRQADGRQRGAHPLAAFGHRLVGKAHDIELAAAGIADVNLHVHFAGFDALKSNRIDMRDRHSAPVTGA